MHIDCDKVRLLLELLLSRLAYMLVGPADQIRSMQLNSLKAGGAFQERDEEHEMTRTICLHPGPLKRNHGIVWSFVLREVIAPDFYS